MIEGVLVLESLKPGTALDTSDLTFRVLRRVEVENPAPWQPSRWTLADFEAEGIDPEAFAAQLAAVLAGPGWYVDFHSEQRVWVVFPGQVLGYARGDEEGRRRVVEYGLSAGVPAAQLDWGD